MTPRAGTLLFVVGLVVLVGGYALGPASVATERAGFAQGTLLFPDLAARLPQAVRIDILSKGQHLTFERPGTDAGAVWGMTQHDGYPVQPARIHELLTGLAELRVVEPRTSDPALYARLGLGDAAKPESEASDLTVFGADGKPIAAVQLGHRQTHAASAGAAAAPETLYVRRPDEARTWLAEGRLPLDTDGQTWLQRDVMSVDAGKIERITVQRGADKLVLARDGTAMKLTEPTPPPPTDPTKLAETARALDLLTFEDVRHADPALPVLSTTTYQIKDGPTLTATQSGDDKDPWTHFTATGKGAESMQHLAAWQYRLGSFKDHLIAPTADSLKPPPTPQTTPGDQLPGMLTPGAPPAPGLPPAK